MRPNRPKQFYYPKQTQNSSNTNKSQAKPQTNNSSNNNIAGIGTVLNKSPKQANKTDSTNINQQYKESKNKSHGSLMSKTKTKQIVTNNQQQKKQNVMNAEQYAQICIKYQSRIDQLQGQLAKLKQQKYERQKYLVKTLKTGDDPLSKSNSSMHLATSQLSNTKFDINQYMARSIRQQQQAKQIQLKASKLKEKQRIQRNLLKKMRDTNRMLRSQQIQASSIRSSQQHELDGVSQEDAHKQTGQQLNGQTSSSRLQYIGHQLQELVKQRNHAKNKQNPDFLDEQSVQIDPQPIIHHDEVQFQSKLKTLSNQNQALKKQLDQEKKLRENYQKHIFQNDNKNSQNTQQLTKKIEQLTEENNKQKQIKQKMQFLLQQNIKLIKVRDNQILELQQKLKTKSETKVESDSDKMSLASQSSNNSNLKKQIQRLKAELLQKSAKIQEMSKLIKHVGRQVSIDLNSSLNLQFLQFPSQKQQSVHFGSEPSQNFVIKQVDQPQQLLNASMQLYSSKLKQTQAQLIRIAAERRRLQQSHDSLEERVMSLQDEYGKISALHRAFSMENSVLKDELSSKSKIASDLEASKSKLEQETQKLKLQSQQNIRTLLKVLEDQKSKQLSQKLSQYTVKLQQSLANFQSQKQSLRTKILQMQQQNKMYVDLNSQLQAQVNSISKLRFHLEQTVNKQQIQIQKYQQNEDKAKEQKDGLQSKIQQSKAEKQEYQQRINKYIQEIKSLNQYIQGMNTQMVRSRIKQKQKQIQQQIIQAQPDNLSNDKEQEQAIKQDNTVTELKYKIQQMESQITKYKQQNTLNINLIRQKDLKINEFIDIVKNYQQKVAALNIQIVTFENKLKQADNNAKQQAEQQLTKQFQRKRSIEALDQQKQAFTTLNKKLALQKQQIVKKCNELQSQLLQSQQTIQKQQLQMQQLSTKIQTIQSANQQKVQSLQSHTQSILNTMKSQQQQISILKLEKSQLQENSDSQEIQISLLNNIIAGMKNKFASLQLQSTKYKQQQNTKALKQQQQKKTASQVQNKAILSSMLELNQIKKQLLQKDQQIKILQQQKQHLIHFQIAHDVSQKKASQLEQKLVQKEAEISKLTEELQKSQEKLHQLTKISQNQSKKLQQLEEAVQSSKQIFIQGIPKDTSAQTQLKASIQSIGVAQISQQKLTSQIANYCNSKTKEYNEQIFKILNQFLLKLAQQKLIKQNSKYLSQIKPLCDEISSYTESRYKKLQSYMQSMGTIATKIPLQQGISTPDYSSSPMITNKNSKDPSSVLKLAKSLQVQLEDHIKQEEHESQKKSEGAKKNVILSDDFNDAFSHQDDDDDRVVNNKYRKMDSINQNASRGSRGSKQGGVDMQGSGSFAKSAHSAMEELQAQQSCKKNLRNIKMKAKHQRRKV